MLFILAWLGLLSTEAAITTSIWIGMGLLLLLGYASGRLQGDDRRGAIKHGLFLAVIGLGVLAAKSIH